MEVASFISCKTGHDFELVTATSWPVFRRRLRGTKSIVSTSSDLGSRSGCVPLPERTRCGLLTPAGRTGTRDARCYIDCGPTALHYLHPHMGTFGVWELGVLLHDRSRRPLKVIAPPPALAKLVNNKIAFAQIVSRLFGQGFVPTTVSAWNMATLCQHVSSLAMSARMIGLKRPDAAGGDAIVVFSAGPMRGGSLHEIHDLLSNLVDGLQWNRNSELLIGCWETEVLCSPSAQLWIPTEADGPPIVEGIYTQFLSRDASVFAGAAEADLPTDLLLEIVTRSWLLARLFQKLGYVGRCSFDAVLVGEYLERSRLEFIECNGRWGGTSLPMSLMNRMFGDWRTKPYAVRTLKVEGLNRISFLRLRELLNSVLYDHRTGKGRLILTTPGLMQHQSAIAVLALGDSRQEATEYLEKAVPVLLKQALESAECQTERGDEFSALPSNANKRTRF